MPTQSVPYAFLATLARTPETAPESPQHLRMAVFGKKLQDLL
jgi:hypothetical protein